jgi:hypothetical protein
MQAFKGQSGAATLLFRSFNAISAALQFPIGYHIMAVTNRYHLYIGKLRHRFPDSAARKGSAIINSGNEVHGEDSDRLS